MVEDSESDALLVLRALRRAGFALRHRRVEEAAEMRAALADETWNVVLSDFNLPGFDARSALAELHASGLDLPFIVVSGTIGDEIAIELMRLGAHDYLMKDNLARLAPAIERELGEACVRAERRRALAALHDSEAVLREAQRIGGVGQWRRDLPGGALWCSDTLFGLFGMAPVAGEDALDALLTRVHPDDLGRLLQAHRALAAGSERVELEYRIIHADGSLRYVLECAARSRGAETATPRLIGTVHDVSA
ncbi:MAG: response regulator, partial [Rhodocyclaceae bacterium]